MGMVFIVLGGLFYLAGFVGGIWLLVEAFKDDVLQGVLCLICGCYALYYAFARLESEHKWLIIGLWLGGGIPGAILVQIGMAMSGSQ